MGRGLLLWLIGIPIPIILSFGFSAGCMDDFGSKWHLTDACNCERR